MSRDALIGIILLITVVCALSYLVFWSRHMINKIGKKGPNTARKIIKGA